MKRFLLLLALSGCASTTAPLERIKTISVNVPVIKSCIPDDFQSSSLDKFAKGVVESAPDSAARFALLAEFYLIFYPQIILQNKLIEDCKVKEN